MGPNPGLDGLSQEPEVVMDLSKLVKGDAHAVAEERLLELLDLGLLLSLLVLVILRHQPVKCYRESYTHLPILQLS